MKSVKIGKIIQRALLDNGDQTQHKFQRMMAFGYDAVAELNSSGMFTLKRVLLEVTKLGTVNIPSDFHSYRTLAVVEGGKILALSQNERINILLPIDECGNEIENNKCCHGTNYSLYETGGYPYYGNYDSGGYHDSGQSGGSAVGQMRLDFERQQFVLSGVSADELLLEYYSLLPEDSLDVNYEVDARLTKAVRAYVHMKLHDPSINKRADVTAFQVAQMNYKNEAYRASAAISPIGIEDIQEAMLAAYKQSITGISGY